MSNRYAHGRPRQQPDSTTRNLPQKKFVPKPHNPISNHAPPGPTLSDSLRRSSSEQAGDNSSSSSGGASSRVRLGESGQWVSGTAQSGSFVNYLPQDEAVAAGLGADEGGLDPVESQRVVDLLNRELTRLLKLKPREFWREVAGDTSLHEFLDSFLKFRSRWYDFPHHGAKGIVAGVIVGELELCHRVFMVLYRISSNRDPGARSVDSLSPKDHAAILQDKKLLDLPKLLDVCAIYGHENEDLTRLLVLNALKAQPWLHYNLTDASSHFLRIVQTMEHRCNSSLQMLLSQSCEDHELKQVHSDFLEVMDFINDAISSMDALVDAYRPAAAYFTCRVETSSGNEDLVCTLVKLHDSLLPSLQKGFRLIYSSSDIIFLGGEMKSTTSMNLKLLSMRLEKFGWNLLGTCYLRTDVLEESLDLPGSTKIFPAKVEDPVIRADIILQAFREVGNLSHQVVENPNHKTYLQQVERNYHVISRLRSLQSSGWIIMDDEQYQYLSALTMSASLPAQNDDVPSGPMGADTNKKAEIEEEAVVLESKISQIKDLFPEYGTGFLSACLEVYNQNPEEVIQRILEGTLHEDLQSLDTSLETVPARKTVSSDRSKDKGKEKVSDFEQVPPPRKTLTASVERQGGGSSSSGGRFVRKSNSLSPDTETLDTRDKTDSEKISALASQYEYEDEYDDSFDDLGLGGVESGVEESEGLRAGPESEVGNQQSAPSSSSKWGSRRKPQYYVKDGKNYSYKVEGSVAVANAKEASLVTQAQGELIYGLGRGGNIPLGAVKRLEEAHQVADEEKQREVPLMNDGKGEWDDPGGRGRGGRGRGRERGRASSHEERDNNQSNIPDGETMRSNPDIGSRGGAGRRGGGRNNHYRKDRAMNKHFSSLGGR